MPRIISLHIIAFLALGVVPLNCSTTTVTPPSSDSDSDSDSDGDTDGDSDSDSDTDSDTDTGPCVDPVDGAPTVTSSDEAYAWDTTDDTYTLTFNEDVFNVDTTNVTWTVVTGSGTMDSITEVSGSEYTVAFSGAAEGDEYTLSVGTGVEDTCGETLAAMVDIAITIEVCVDPVVGDPTVTSADDIFPVGTTTGTYTLTFSEDVLNVDTTSVTWAAVTGSGTMGTITAVDGSTYDIALSGLADGDHYELTVGTSVTDTCGNPIAAAVVINIYVSLGGSSVRIDELQIGSSDYVVLYNPTGSSIDLNPMALYFDDSSTGDFAFDLPSYILAPGGYVYIAEVALAGDIDVVSNIPFSSSRGGWVALCSGTCNLSTGSNWIDAVAFSEGDPHPPLPSGITFSPAGLSGIVDQNTNSYYHTSTVGSQPVYLAADWTVSASSR